jgi:pectate lyase
VGGTITGSGNKNVVTVTSAADLVKAMSGTDAKTIYVKGTLVFSGQLAVQNAANKTVYGLPGSVLSNPVHTGSVDKTGILMIKNSRNIILRNLTFKGAGAYDIDGKDNLTLQNCQYMWVDHCDFQDGVDGNFDANNGSDNISVTWCRFRYLIKPWAGGSGGSDKHCFSDLWGGSDKNISKDGGKLNTTFANCWWDEGCIERMPRVRFGKIHIVNCLYSSSVASYCIGAAYRSNIYVENTAFTSRAAQKNPWAVKATSSGYKDYNITLKGCYGASDTQSRSGSQSFFNPYSYYKYTPYAANLVESVVSSGAGATLSISVGGWPKTSSAKQSVIGMETSTTSVTTTAIENTNALENSAAVTSVRYFSVNGQEISALRKGINIVRTTYADGTVKTTKVFRR